jgi:hypothetical protein
MSFNSLIESREDGTPSPYPLDNDSWHTLSIFISFLDWQEMVEESQAMIDRWKARIDELRSEGELDRAVWHKFRLERWLRIDAMLWGIMEAYENAYFRASYSDCKSRTIVVSESESLILRIVPCELNTREENPSG